MRIKDLATRATKLLTGNAYMVFDNGTKVEKVDYAELAKQIITEYNTQTLAGSAQSVKSALDALNSNNVYVNSVDNVNSGLISHEDTNAIFMKVYSTEITRLLTNNNTLNNASAQIWFTKANNTTFQYVLALLNTNDVYTGIYNPNTSTVNNVNKLPTRAEIDALNSNIIPQIKPVSYTAGENINVRDLKCVKMGKLVELNLYFDTTAQVTNNAHLVDITDGLPKPIGSYAIGIARAVNGSFTLVSLERVHNTYLQSWGTTPVGTYYYAKLLYITDEE